MPILRLFVSSSGKKAPRRAALAGLIAGAWLAAAPPAAGQQEEPAARPPAASRDAILPDRPPRLLNGEEAEREIAAAYPPDHLARGVAGEVYVRFRVLADGTVDSASVVAVGAEDAAFAKAVSRGLRFAPAEVRGGPVNTMHALTIRFFPTPEAAAAAGYPNALSTSDLQHKLVNTDLILREMGERHPPALLACRVAGAVYVRFRLLTDGTVDSASVSAVHASDTAFVAPAVAVARKLAFTPAVLGGRPAEAWYGFDIRFLPTASPDGRGDRQPGLRNGAEVDRLIAARYPPDLKAQGVSGAAILRLKVLEDGSVDPASILRLESTREAFVEPATAVARRMSFTPATVAGRPVAYWHSFLIRFTAPGAVRWMPADEGTYDLSAVEVAPRVRNAREIERQIEALFPPALADSGVAGEVVVRLKILENGTVEPSSVSVERTTHPGFAEAAVAVAGQIRFTPAMVNNRPVAVWVTVPIYFRREAPAAAGGNPPAQAGRTTPGAAAPDRDPRRGGRRRRETELTGEIDGHETGVTSTPSSCCAGQLRCLTQRRRVHGEKRGISCGATSSADPTRRTSRASGAARRTSRRP